MSVVSCESQAVESIDGCCGVGAGAVLELEPLLLTRSCLSPSLLSPSPASLTQLSLLSLGYLIKLQPEYCGSVQVQRQR